MSSKKPKAKGEKEFYEPIKEVLERVFSSYVEERPLMGAPFSYEENPYLEIIGDKKRFSERLKKEFDNDTLNILGVEKNLPDIMGYVKKKPSSPKELITVEVKNRPISLMNILQAKFYQDLFKSTFGLLISTKGIAEEKVRFVLDTNLGRNVVRGKVIIAQFIEEPAAQYGYFTSLEINSKFKDSVPVPFKRFCEP